ncbi:50S ribosomal protein L4 [Candidatus Pacearchaeota archaeon]|nr:50S ribosomal protein L4 [Candidatus Pacearchaeota archaeon]
MKAVFFDAQGNKKGSIELPKLFVSKIREDIVLKYFETEKLNNAHRYSTMPGAGLRQVGYGSVRHKRHEWKVQYGKGISRTPRKTMSRRGTQFYWVGANAPNTRGGRRAHPPSGIKKERKINRKEIEIAINSGFAATAIENYIKKRYENISKIDNLPIVIEELPKRTKELLSLLNKIFGENSALIFKIKKIRAGKGKLRGRKYKSNAGVLIVVGEKEEVHFRGIDVKKINEIKISDLYPLGRLAVYTKNALEELSGEEEK